MDQLGLPSVPAPAPAAPRPRCKHCGAGFVPAAARRRAARDRVAAQRARPPAKDWAAEWDREIDAHPADEVKIEAYALLLASRTTKRIRMAKVWEDMRGSVEVNLDNNYRKGAARRMMDRHPALVGRFELRDTPGNPDWGRRGRRRAR